MKLRKPEVLEPTGDQPEDNSRVPWASVQFRTNDGLPAPKPAEEKLVDDDLIFDAQHRFSENNLIARHALQLVLTVVALLTYHGPARTTLLAGLIVSSILGGFLATVLPRTSSRISPIPSLVDGFANLFMVVAAPELFPYVSLIALAQFGLAVVAIGVIEAAIGMVPLILAYPLAKLRGTVFKPDLTSLGLFLGGFPFAAYVSGRIRTIERKTRRKYLELLGELEAVVWEADPQTLELTFASPQVRSLFGVAPNLFVKRWFDFVHPDDKENIDQQRRGAIKAREESFTLEHRMVHHDGELVYVRTTYSVQYDSRGPIRIRGVITDVTRQQEAEQTIRKQAQYDTLTGLPNRSLFNDQLKRRLDDVRRSSEGLAVLLLDLNGFKEVNDTLGHAVGDQLLQAIAGRLAAYLPERSLVARLGGDEFAVMVHPANQRTAATLAETIAACLQPPITVDSMTIQAGASTGIALYPQDGDSPAVLLRRADAAMYSAKQSGRTHMFATPDDDEGNVRRLQLLGELRASITTGDFRLYHQPKIDLRTGAIVGTEGLVRWQHRQFGVLSPAEFVELTELSGLIQPLTRWVIEQGIRDLAEWRRAGLELMVALNLSVRNFFDQGLPGFIAQLLHDYKVPGHQLVLEITEREVMADRALARTALLSFRELGVKISIDDFGTGFSSLSQLQQLPIDEIKVDQSFVFGMLTNPQDGVIVRSIIDLGRNLDLEVVAEGAEDVEQIAALRDLGADRAQGYFISRPLPGEEFKKWLAKLEPRVIDGKRMLIFPGAPLGDAAPGRFGSSSGRVLVAAGSRSTDSESRVAVAVPGVGHAVSSVNLPVPGSSAGVHSGATDQERREGSRGPKATQPAGHMAGKLVSGAAEAENPLSNLFAPKPPETGPSVPVSVAPSVPVSVAPSVPVAPSVSVAPSVPVSQAPQVSLETIQSKAPTPAVQRASSPPVGPAEIHSPLQQIQMSHQGGGYRDSTHSAAPPVQAPPVQVAPVQAHPTAPHSQTAAAEFTLPTASPLPSPVVSEDLGLPADWRNLLR